MIALTGLLDSSFSNYNITKEGTALPNGTPALRHFRAHEFETYAQDSWRVTPQLTLTYGLRYTLLQPPYETTGTQVSPSISLESFLQNRGKAMLAGQTYNPPISYVLSGQANGKPPYWNWDYGNLAPRFAFAWSPKADRAVGGNACLGGRGRASIRGGYGIYYDHFGQGIVDSFDRNGSFGLTTTIPNPIGQYTIDDSPRFSGINTIPSAAYCGATDGRISETGSQRTPRRRGEFLGRGRQDEDALTPTCLISPSAGNCRTALLWMWLTSGGWDDAFCRKKTWRCRSTS